MKKVLRVGEPVTTVEPVEAYYSNYAGQPAQWFTPGMVGYIKNGVEMPCVYTNNTFYTVMFTGANGKTWQVALHPRQIRCVSTLEEETDALPDL
jgi:hypothetical protein